MNADDLGFNVSDNPASFTMTCPNCGNLVPPDPVVQNLTVCPSCWRSLAIDGTDGVGLRLATGNDTTALTDAEITTLRNARKAVRTTAPASHASATLSAFQTDAAGLVKAKA